MSTQPGPLWYRYRRQVMPIIEASAELCGVPAGDILSRRSGFRAQDVALARRLAIYTVRERLHWSLQRIGKAFGGLHHTTVSYAIATMRSNREADPDIRAALDLLAGVPCCSPAVSVALRGDTEKFSAEFSA